MSVTRNIALTISLIAAAISLSTASSLWADEKEPELLAILRSEKPAGDKAIACKLLAIHGSKEAVPDLAKLLPDSQLASWARIALEAIPGTEADEALRKATGSLEGVLLVGTINSIGVRRDQAAVETLTPRLQDQDAEVASAAAVALGRIGSADAAKSLRAALAATSAPVRSAVAEGCVLCAERLLATGKSAEAIEIYDQVRQAEVPKPRIIEATRGAILARGQAGLPLLLEQLHSADRGLFLLGLSTAREFPGTAVDLALAKEIATAAPPQAALIVHAIADRKQPAALPALVSAAGTGAKPVRVAALAALGKMGDDSCLDVLLKSAQETDAEIAQAAKGTIAELQGEKVNAEIVAQLEKAEGANYAMLIELVGQRRISAVPMMLKALDHSDNKVRASALAALGETVSLKELPVLVSHAITPKRAEDAAAAQQALKAASVRMPDRDACATILAAAQDKAPTAMKVTILEILGEVGGTKSLQTLGAAAKSRTPELQDAGSRILGTWNSVEAAPVLFDLAKTAPQDRFKTRALRGYIGLLRKFPMPDAERAEMCQQAFDIARLPEQKLVLEVLKIHPSKQGLDMAIKARQVSDLKDDAMQATLVIAQKLGTKGEEIGQLLAKAGFDKVKLEIVKAEYGSGSTQRDVTAILQKQAGDLPLITLPAANYNASFGGDPRPSSVKQLKIQYRINGKAGEATFAENAVIILPMPN